MSAIETIKKINGKLQKADNTKIIEIWNCLFPKEEHLTENALDSTEEENKAMLTEEVIMMITDELKDCSAFKIIEIYNLLYKKKITIEDL